MGRVIGISGISEDGLLTPPQILFRKENDMLISKNNSLKAAVRKAQEVGHETGEIRQGVKDGWSEGRKAGRRAESK